MRLEQRLREGLETISVQSPRIGDFEQYTRVSISAALDDSKLYIMVTDSHV